MHILYAGNQQRTNKQRQRIKYAIVIKTSNPEEGGKHFADYIFKLFSGFELDQFDTTCTDIRFIGTNCHHVIILSGNECTDKSFQEAIMTQIYEACMCHMTSMS